MQHKNQRHYIYFSLLLPYTAKIFYYVRMLIFQYISMMSIGQYNQHSILEPQAGDDILHVVSKAKPVYGYRFLKL